VALPSADARRRLVNCSRLGVLHFPCIEHVRSFFALGNRIPCLAFALLFWHIDIDLSDLIYSFSCDFARWKRRDREEIAEFQN
jgi:hypothetical protein